MATRDRYREGFRFIFINCEREPGCPLHTNTVERLMKKDLIDAGLPASITPHSLRHTYTSLMAEAGVELAAIQRLLGHKTGSKITERIYLHVTKARKRAAVEKLDQLINQVQRGQNVGNIFKNK